MPIPFRCSSCGQEYPLTDAHAGRRVQCAFCGEYTRAGPPVGAGVAPTRGRATSLHQPDLTPLANLEPTTTRPTASSAPATPQYAMDFIAPPPKKTAAPKTAAPKTAALKTAAAKFAAPETAAAKTNHPTPPPAPAIAPASASPASDASDEIVDLATIEEDDFALAPPPLQRSNIVIPRATTSRTTSRTTSTPTSSFAKPQSGGRSGGNSNRPARKKLDEVWLLLSDEQARLISALLLVAMLLGSAYGSYKFVSVITEGGNIPEAIANRFTSYMWMTTGWSILLFFVVMAPLVLGAGALACLWTKWTLPERPLLRATGAATVPYLLIFLLILMALNKQPYVALGVLLASPFVLIIALKELMGLRWSTTAVTALLLLVAVPVVSLITLPLTLRVNSRAMQIAEIDPASMQKWIDEHPKEAQASALKDARFLRENRPGPGAFPPLPSSSSPPSSSAFRSAPSLRGQPFESPAVQMAKRDSLFEQLQPLIVELQTVHQQANSKTREELQQSYDQLAPQVNALKPSDGSNSPRWNVAVEMVKSLERDIKAAPSASPPPEVFEPVAARAESPLQVPQAEPGEFQADEVPFRDVRIRPLKRVKINAESYLRGETTQRWDLTSTASIELELLPLRGPKQQRPWVADRRAIQQFAEAKNLLAFADDGYDAPQFARIGEISWTRISRTQGERKSEVLYVGRLPSQWLMVRLKSIRPTENEIDAIDKFVQGIRDATAAPTTNPATATTGPSVAGTSPVPAVTGAGAGEINVLLEIIRGAGYSGDRNEAIKKLAKIKPANAEQREVIAPILERFIVSDDVPFAADDATEALGVWWRPWTIDVMLPLLDEKEWVGWKRQRAMKVLARTGEKRAALPIMRWLLKDTDAVVAAMIELGPAAEEEAIARLREKEPTARAAAARILSAIGTQKCLIELRRAANDGRDPGAAASARSALGTVLARIKQAKATTTTTTMTTTTTR